jgi:DNA sulfur modification protein DndC
MAKTNSAAAKSVFKQHGLRKTVDNLLEDIRELYLSDQVPWVVGYSGGKDSTAALQLIWMALSSLNAQRLHKTVHVISTDTLVENPLVAAWVEKSLVTMGKSAEAAALPFSPHRLTPDVSETFWVNLIGKGYPSPRSKFRWCTERLKIKPSNAFIRKVVQQSGEAILVLGTRKAESSARSQAMTKMAERRMRARLSPNPSLPNSHIFSPIEDWSNDDVWLFLMQIPNPWGYNNKDLLALYQGASPDGECPLVIDTTTPSCGDSRFGCWVCTVVEQDRSMTSMLANDDDMEWVRHLLKIRDALGERDPEDKTKRADRHLRDFRRMDGRIKLLNGRAIAGPYTQEARENWLRMLLKAQCDVRESGYEPVKDIELISLAELHEIRRIWVVDKHEIEDSLPRIYREVIGEKFPGEGMDDNLPFGAEEVRLLREACEGDRLHFELTRELLDIERRYQTSTRRAGLYEALEQAFRRGFYTDEEDAAERARKRLLVKDAIESELAVGGNVFKERSDYLLSLSGKAALQSLLDEVNRMGEA